MVIAEIGINHNGDVEVAKKLIDVAEAAGCNAVKFQKRTIDIVYTPEELAKTPGESLRRAKTDGDLKYGLEFEEEDYRESNVTARTWGSSGSPPAGRGRWTSSNGFTRPVTLASASLTDDQLLTYTRKAASNRPILLSTGMSTLEQIDHAVEVLGKKDLLLLHACSTYPSYYNEINLKVIQTLANRYDLPVGYSGHETGLPSSIAAVAMGACMVERHISLDRSMSGIGPGRLP